MRYAYLADGVVAVHMAFVAFVVFGQLAVVACGPFGWGAVRNFTFRVLHLAAIGVVAFESLAGVECPLTTWEHNLREAAGQPVDRGATFIGDLLHRWLFYEADPAVFTKIYVGFALLVLLTWVLLPPRLPEGLKRRVYSLTSR
jgi:hypothetical protein